MDSNSVSKIVAALELVHSPRSSNEARKEAEVFLSEVKKQDQSPLWGYELASPSQSFIVRHFGLALLQNSINNSWRNYDEEKKLAIRKWVIDLANNLQQNDPHYLKEKLAFLWVAIAKKVWGSFLSKESTEKASFQEFTEGWSSMDHDLSKLWFSSSQTRELSLIIFRTLFEDIYILDDPVTMKRNYILCSLCSNVLLPDSLLNIVYEHNVNLEEAKATKEGWFMIWQEFLNESIRNGDERSIIKVLETFKTCMNWPYSTLITQSQITRSLLNTILISNVRIKILSVDCLHMIFTRSFNQNKDLDEITNSIFSSEGIALFRNIYNSITNDPDDIDDETYAFTKKYTEVIVGLSEHLQPDDLRDWDIKGYLELILQTTCSDSLTISAISLNFWGYMLREKQRLKIIEPVIPNLLEVAASKLLNYGDLNENHNSLKFLAADFNSKADSFSFVSNYKRLVYDIVRLTTCIKADESLNWLNQRLVNFFGSDIAAPIYTSQALDYHGESFIYVISQLDITEAAVRGIIRWKIWYENADYNEKLAELVSKVESLFEKLLNVPIKDPVVLRKLIQILVQFSPLLNDQSIFKLIEKLLTVCTYEYVENASDVLHTSIKDLRNTCGLELNRLAFMMPQNLKNILDDLENVFDSLAPKLSTSEIITFKSFLLVVSQRTDTPNKDERFVKIVDPELAAWSNPDTIKGLSDLHWFMERLGIVQIADYFKSRNISPGTDLLNAEMDERGLKLKSELSDRWSAIFPTRTTRLLIQYSIEKLPHDSADFQRLLKLWKPRLITIVPNILQLLYQIQAYHDPENWKSLPDIVQSFVRESTKERFWQMGVSIQSRDEFLEETVKAMHTLRDFADSVGHVIRYTREYVFLSIASIAQLGDTLYTIPNIATVFWKAATTEKVGITLHSWKHLISVTLRPIIKSCPLECVESFMTELLPQVFVTFDELIVSRWEKVYISEFKEDEDDQELSEEMMEEHMLRQTTQAILRVLLDCVGQDGYKKLSDSQLAIKELIFANKSLLAPFLQLATHLMMVNDSKTAFNVILVFKGILPDLVLKDDEVDKYLCEHLTKALVKFLTSQLYVEGHYDGLYVLTVLYTNMRSRGTYIYDVFKSCLPYVTSEAIEALEVNLSESKTTREQRNSMNEFINICKNGEQFDDENYSKNRKTQLEMISKKKKADTDIMNDPFLENGAIGNLFGGDQ